MMRTPDVSPCSLCPCLGNPSATLRLVLVFVFSNATSCDRYFYTPGLRTNSDRRMANMPFFL